MSLKWITECLPFFLIGTYLVIKGLTSKTLINEADVQATPEERSQAKATPVRRLIVVAVGLAGIIYAVICSRQSLR
jgi:hypothetical protein